MVLKTPVPNAPHSTHTHANPPTHTPTHTIPTHTPRSRSGPLDPTSSHHS